MRCPMKPRPIINQYLRNQVWSNIKNKHYHREHKYLVRNEELGVRNFLLYGIHILNY